MYGTVLNISYRYLHQFFCECVEYSRRASSQGTPYQSWRNGPPDTGLSSNACAHLANPSLALLCCIIKHCGVFRYKASTRSIICSYCYQPWRQWENSYYARQASYATSSIVLFEVSRYKKLLIDGSYQFAAGGPHIDDLHKGPSKHIVTL